MRNNTAYEPLLLPGNGFYYCHFDVHIAWQRIQQLPLND